MAATAASPASAGIIDIGDPTKMPDHSVSFSDVLSTLNPLQYIPIIGSIYRAITGDAAPQAAQVLGGALLGGPLGLIASAANAVVEQSSGKDVGEHVIAMLLPQGDAPPASPQNQRYAANTPPTAASVAAATGDTVPTQAAAETAATPPSPSAATPPDPAAPPAQPQSSATPASTVASAPLALPPQAAAGTGTATLGSLKPAGAGYTLADYRTFAGSGMPPPPNGNIQRTAMVPLQTTIPLPNDVSRTPVVATTVQAPANVAPAPAATPAVQPQDTWVSQAMMRGLDRYRDMMRQQEQQQQPGT